MSSKYRHFRNDFKIEQAEPKKEPAKPKPPSRYPNRRAHPEFQNLEVQAGITSAHMKQLEVLEELLRAQIDIGIANLPSKKQAEMREKYRNLI